MYRSCAYSLLITVSLFSYTLYAANDTFIITTQIGPDTTPPSIPTGLTATPVATTQIDLSWNPSTDDFTLSGYQVFRDDAQIATTTATNYSDVGLTPSTTYAYYVTAFDSSNNISASSTVVATTTLSTSTPPATTTPEIVSSGGGKLIELKAPLIELSRLEIIPDTTSVRILYETPGFVRSIIKWGRSVSYELGSLAERSFGKFHESNITGLSPNTTYSFTIEGENHVGVYGVLTTGTFKTLPLDDVFPPANVSNLRAREDNGDIILEWDNPDDADFNRVRVLRSDLFYPSDTADGWLVYEDSGERVRDEGIAIPGTRQYYTVFSYDENGNISSGAVIALSIGTGILVPIDIVDEELNPIDLSFLDIHFIQDGKRLRVEDDRVLIDGSKQLTVAVPYESVPEHLKTILMTLGDSSDRNKEFSFLLRINSVKDAYIATLAPLGTAGIFPLRISVFDFKTEQVGYASGEVVSTIVHAPGERDERTFVQYVISILFGSPIGYLMWFLLVLILLLLYAKHLLSNRKRQQQS